MLMLLSATPTPTALIVKTASSPSSTRVSAAHHGKKAQQRSKTTHDFVKQMSEAQQKALDRIYSSTVDASCMPSCDNGGNAEEYNLLTCRQLSFLTFFDRTTQPTTTSSHNNNNDSNNNDSEMDYPTPGAYAVPTFCEYCGSSSTKLCSDDCPRPKLFFKKKRPPFCFKPNKWDPTTEYLLDPPQEKNNNDTNNDDEKENKNNKQESPGKQTNTKEQQDIDPAEVPIQDSSSSWVNGLCGSSVSMTYNNED